MASEETKTKHSTKQAIYLLLTKYLSSESFLQYCYDNFIREMETASLFADQTEIFGMAVYRYRSKLNSDK